MDKKGKIPSLVLGIVMLVLGGGILFWSLDRISDENVVETDTDVSVTDNSAIDTNEPTDSNNEAEVSEPAEETVVYTHRVELPDVTEGAIIQGISTGNLASGVAESVFNDGTYMLSVNFSNLPEPINGSFYEGWLVEPGTTNFFSTGVVEKDEEGNYIDTFIDITDWNQSHTFYVLTLEPNDGDPAPADHIVEAVLAEI